MLDRMTPSQFITQRVGSDAETICALLGDIKMLEARVAELEAALEQKGRDGDNGPES
jgi:hypothetical protein